MTLPKIVGFRLKGSSPERYLCNTRAEKFGSTDYSLSFTAEEVLDPHAKFVVGALENGLVQIRSSFQNKWWSRIREDELWIGAYVSSPIKDTKNWQCTSFKPNIDESRVTFTHVQSGKKLVLKEKDGVEKLSLEEEGGVTTTKVVEATFIDISTMVKLPKYVQFLDNNSNFLRGSELTYELPPGTSQSPNFNEVSEGTRQEFLLFKDKDSTAKATLFEIVNLPSGSVGIKYVHTGKLWSAPIIWDKWIFAKSESPFGLGFAKNQFEPIKLVDGDDMIALKNIFHGTYVKKFRNFYYTDCLNVKGSELNDYACKFKVVEPIKERKVQVVSLRHDCVRIVSDVQEAVIEKKDIRNDGTSEITKVVQFTKYKEYQQRSWGKSSFLQTPAPFWLNSATPEYNGNFFPSREVVDDKSYQWRKINEKKTEPKKEDYTVKVPARSVRTVKLIARKIVYEVPYNYDQYDVLSDIEDLKPELAKTELKDERDGIFYGVLQFDYKIIVD